VLALASGDPALDYVGTGGSDAPDPWRGGKVDDNVLNQYAQFVPSQDPKSLPEEEVQKALQERPVLLQQARSRLNDILTQFETEPGTDGKSTSWPKDASGAVRSSANMQQLLRTVVGDVQRVSQQRQPPPGQTTPARNRWFVRHKNKFHRTSNGIAVFGTGKLEADFNWHWDGISRTTAGGHVVNVIPLTATSTVTVLPVTLPPDPVPAVAVNGDVRKAQ